LETGGLKLDKKSTNLGRLLHNVIAEAQVRLQGQRLKLDLPEELPKVNIDEHLIRQVLDNLTNNTVQYSELGTEIVLAAYLEADELIISVTDHGIGIAKEDLPRVFDRMFRCKRSQTMGVKGVGLGLSICKGLVEMHGGRIWIESEEGKGTRCSFTLPIYSQASL